MYTRAKPQAIIVYLILNLRLDAAPKGVLWVVEAEDPKEKAILNWTKSFTMY